MPRGRLASPGGIDSCSNGHQLIALNKLAAALAKYRNQTSGCFLAAIDSDWSVYSFCRRLILHSRVGFGPPLPSEDIANGIRSGLRKRTLSLSRREKNRRELFIVEVPNLTNIPNRSKVSHEGAILINVKISYPQYAEKKRIQLVSDMDAFWRKLLT
ncbi:hypothetical protein AVEN_266128-1 [Araneus ventricosus]|uniref:Uncharacterized protein n=1 Tax=Araneus ventricosus TaxID=182803 RepID=A0A4Y2G876_ARAVE|nr:hypothetical protein AVEN_266128-1 [Araneus ventricosus]